MGERTKTASPVTRARSHGGKCTFCNRRSKFEFCDACMAAASERKRAKHATPKSAMWTVWLVADDDDGNASAEIGDDAPCELGWFDDEGHAEHLAGLLRSTYEGASFDVRPPRGHL